MKIYDKLNRIKKEKKFFEKSEEHTIIIVLQDQHPFAEIGKGLFCFVMYKETNLCFEFFLCENIEETYLNFKDFFRSYCPNEARSWYFFKELLDFSEEVYQEFIIHKAITTI